MSLFPPTTAPTIQDSAPTIAGAAIRPPLVEELATLRHGDIPRVGGKAANLGELIAAGLPVPGGFVVSIDAYERVREATGIGDVLRDLLANLPVDDAAALAARAAELRRTVTDAAIPTDVAAGIATAYRSLGGDGPVSVAVRSSATAEDATEFSFAGMFESFLGVEGVDALLEAVRRCWASTFGARVLYYRLTHGFPAEMPVAVVVQRMIRSEKAGVMFTVDPQTGNAERVVIEAAWGVGESVVSGQVTPDHYEVEKTSRRAIVRTIATKQMAIALRAGGGTERITLRRDARSTAAVLTDRELGELTRLALAAEKHFGAPQDMEFAIAAGKVHVTQSRPITTIRARAETPAPPTPPGEPVVLVRGLAAGPGRASGAVRVLRSPSEIGALAQGEILVAPLTSPDWVPLMRRAAAIVTDTGGMTSHAAIVSRELGLPCIVGTGTATTTLTDGLIVTVDGGRGVVLAGAVATAPGEPVSRVTPPAAAPAPIITGTRIYVNLADPERASEIAARDVDGVGLLRAEFMLLSALQGRHPREMLARGEGDEFVRRMAERLTVFAEAFAPRPIVYRTMDFRSNEFRGLEGGAGFEPVEENPMIGYRGCFRYTQEPELFGFELRAVAEVRRQWKNIHVMIPFVRTGAEFRECRRLIDDSALAGDRELQLWVMAEVPSVVTWMEEYVKLGVTGVSIGSNDLTQLVLGVDRDSSMLSARYDERDPAVLDAIRTIIERAHSLGITCSICGQAPSVHPDYAARLVEWGIDSISVNPDAIESTRRNVAMAERRLLLRAARRAVAG